MNKPVSLIKAKYMDGLLVELTFGDGVVVHADFAEYFDKWATPKERSYKPSQKFKRFKVIGTHALEWGDAELIFSAEKLREGHSRGVHTKVIRAAA